MLGWTAPPGFPGGADSRLSELIARLVRHSPLGISGIYCQAKEYQLVPWRGRGDPSEVARGYVFGDAAREAELACLRALERAFDGETVGDVPWRRARQRADAAKESS